MQVEPSESKTWVIKNGYKFDMVKKIIQVKDSIPWVLCASGNVCWKDRTSLMWKSKMLVATAHGNIKRKPAIRRFLRVRARLSDFVIRSTPWTLPAVPFPCKFKYFCDEIETYWLKYHSRNQPVQWSDRGWICIPSPGWIQENTYPHWHWSTSLSNL